MLKQKLLNLSLLNLFLFVIIFYLALTTPPPLPSNELKIDSQTLCSMDMNNPPLQSNPNPEDHPIVTSPAKTDLTKPYQTSNN
uniref:Female-specific orf protein n=1 Tax=Aculamprotula tientsinensis TaxID=1758753 RepID=A0A0X9H6L6_9BIVA|nr:female-specific orf protein [Aculamprotula tientsinensis]ALP29945.1 female-specific orf protein [Aculamprotula tientsinensis]